MSETIWLGLEQLIGQRIQIETKDGCYRHEVLTGIEWTEVNVGGRALRTPEAIRLGDDNGDTLKWDSLKQISDAG